VSIDNIDSVWVRDIPAPGAIELGGTETPINSINMYGIVAVPLDTAATATEQKQPTKGNTNEVNVNDKSAGKGRIDSGTRK
jgi:hypothetical protein